MYKTIATSAQNQIITKNSGLVLDDEDIEILVQALTYAQDALDMDNMDAIKVLSTVREVLDQGL